MDSTHLTAFTVFMGVIGALYPEAIADSTEIMSPRILLPRKCVIRVVPGEQFVMTCKADPGLPDDFTCVYWLVNNTFPDAAYTDGRVSETEEFTSQDGRMIQKSLVFQKVTAEDLRSNFTCVINSPAGIDRKTVKLTPIHKAVVPSNTNVFCLFASSVAKCQRKQRKELRKRRRNAFILYR